DDLVPIQRRRFDLRPTRDAAGRGAPSRQIHSRGDQPCGNLVDPIRKAAPVLAMSCRARAEGSQLVRLRRSKALDCGSIRRRRGRGTRMPRSGPSVNSSPWRLFPGFLVRPILASLVTLAALSAAPAAWATTTPSKIAGDLQQVIDAPKTPKLNWAKDVGGRRYV